MTLESTQFPAFDTIKDSKKLVEDGTVSGKGTAILASVAIEDILGDPLQDHCLTFSAHLGQTSKHPFRHTFVAIRLFGLNIFQ